MLYTIQQQRAKEYFEDNPDESEYLEYDDFGRETYYQNELGDWDTMGYDENSETIFEYYCWFQLDTIQIMNIITCK